jgi:hypothetical protein
MSLRLRTALWQGEAPEQPDNPVQATDDAWLTAMLRLRPRRAVIPALGHGSDFAGRLSVLDCGAEGYVGQVGACSGVSNSLGQKSSGSSVLS